MSGRPRGTDAPGLFLILLVDDTPAGDYTFRFAPGDWLVGEDGVTEATFDFSIAKPG